MLLCLHPNEPYHLDILRESCDRFLFVHKGSVTPAASFNELVQEPRVLAYLGRLASAKSTSCAEATPFLRPG